MLETVPQPEEQNNQTIPIMKKILSFKFFIILILILLAGSLFLGGLYYVLNIQGQKKSSDIYSPTGNPITSIPKSLSLDLTSPYSDQLVFEPAILISGKTAPNLAVLLSTDFTDLIVQSKIDGSFSATLDLDEGVNNIKVIVYDLTGEARIEERTVYFSKEKI